MPSTVGHTLFGLACYAVIRRYKPELATDSLWRGIFVFSFLANLPDIDMLIGYFFASDYLAYHWGFTHTIAFSLFAGVLASYMVGLGGFMKFRLWWILVLVVASHNLLDLLTGPQWGFNASYGLRVFWPLWDEKIIVPFSLFLGVQHGADKLFTMHNVFSVLIEMALLVPVLIVCSIDQIKQWLRCECRM